MDFMKGIDVSEHNGLIDWGAVKNAGYEFALVRLGWGRSHLDNRFYENINGAISKNLKVGAYYYSYALDEVDAADEERNDEMRWFFVQSNQQQHFNHSW